MQPRIPHHPPLWSWATRSLVDSGRLMQSYIIGLALEELSITAHKPAWDSVFPPPKTPRSLGSSARTVNWTSSNMKAMDKSHERQCLDSFPQASCMLHGGFPSRPWTYGLDSFLVSPAFYALASLFYLYCVYSFWRAGMRLRSWIWPGHLYFCQSIMVNHATTMPK